MDSRMRNWNLPGLKTSFSQTSRVRDVSWWWWLARCGALSTPDATTMMLVPGSPARPSRAAFSSRTWHSKQGLARLGVSLEAAVELDGTVGDQGQGTLVGMRGYGGQVGWRMVRKKSNTKRPQERNKRKE